MKFSNDEKFRESFMISWHHTSKFGKVIYQKVDFDISTGDRLYDTIGLYGHHTGHNGFLFSFSINLLVWFVARAVD